MNKLFCFLLRLFKKNNSCQKKATCSLPKIVECSPKQKNTMTHHKPVVAELPKAVEEEFKLEMCKPNEIVSVPETVADEPIVDNYTAVINFGKEIKIDSQEIKLETFNEPDDCCKSMPVCCKAELSASVDSPITDSVTANEQTKEECNSAVTQNGDAIKYIEIASERVKAEPKAAKKNAKANKPKKTAPKKKKIAKKKKKS